MHADIGAIASALEQAGLLVERRGTANIALTDVTDDSRVVHDGRVLVGQLDEDALPSALEHDRGLVRNLGTIYKQLNAPFGDFSMNVLAASTKAIKSGSATDDSRYTSVEAQISTLTSQRDTLAVQIRNALDAAAFDHHRINRNDARDWIAQAQFVIGQSATLAASA